jgi:hypothetical protein
MTYTKTQWLKRIHLRSDISGSITHLTREIDSINAIDVLIKILNDKTIIGSAPNKGFIIGATKAVCFQDAPIHGLTQNLINEQYNRPELGNKIRYRGIGLGFSKKYAFIKGARPVFYESKEIAKSFLPESEWWRIVSFDLSDDQNIIDWTHEREWRIKGDFCFELNEAYVYLVNQSSYQSFIERAGNEIIKGIKGIVVLDPVLT